ncbi:MAG: PH domain-containing protein [Candidatus Microsaccharimonas sp.]
MTEKPQPVAYDVDGRPLYAHPPEPVAPPQPITPPVVHITRPISPEKAVISAEDKRRHDESKLMYPTLNLSAGEFVVSAVRRHPIGLIIPLGLGTILIGLTLGVLLNYDAFAEALALTGSAAEVATVAIPLLLFCVLIGLGMFITWYVYVSNKFFLTNESVVQEIQHTLFSRLEQTVSLSSIEDASFTQVGILQHIFNYGDIRLSTEGDETTYRFSYVASPRDHVSTLNDAVEAFKNGRPVGNQD